ncbi:FAD-dependent oxidoreductase [Sphingobacterium sp. SGG-5]|uniref:FAD-dependent oxidoreductase n=1 Tax=Sphingobacterium sp. SGG-5 TaxID=2710881 RepID=UPI0013EE2EAB|nr:FAD-dependent oxidoreductase [Sphingobacterium sp. SGG-5]NGM63094.1 FAD-dependent oxidoreductase [Sphingobacterium sp. SGG-5]
MRYYILVSSFIFMLQSAFAQAKDYDICVYGGTSAGITAAIEASRLGKSVVLIEPTKHLGGLTTGGLGATDIGNKQAIGGIAREFYQRIKAYYRKPSSWKWQTPDEYMSKKTNNWRNKPGEDAMWTFEPSVALKIYQDMINEAQIVLRMGERLDRKQGVRKAGNVITEITTLEGGTYKAKMFIDATYEGDLMAAAGVSYTYGRESNGKYGETLNGVQANKTNLSLTGLVSRNARFHNFVDGVDPYVVKGDPSSGLLPMINPDGPGVEGQGDKKIQAYCFRMTLTDVPENRIPFEKPKTYNEQYYELLFRNYEAAPDGRIDKMYGYGDPIIPWINTPMPNRKTDINNQKGLSTNFIGQNYAYPEADYKERERIIAAHREYQKGLMWTLAYHPRIPKQVRDEVSRWGTCKDEYEREDGWQEQLYIREARRMVSDYVITQHDCERLRVADDPIGMAAYTMDSHMVQRYVDADGFVRNEGNVACRIKKPYPISYRAIIPKQEECSNLLVPVCVSSSHIAFGSIRMEPVFMVLGQSAAVAAVHAINERKPVQEISYADLKIRLEANGQVLRQEKD